MSSKAQTILTALKTALETARTGTVYPPDVVQVVLFWPDETALDASLQTIYLIRPSNERGGPGPTSCEVREDLHVFVLVAHRYTSPSDNPFLEDPPRWQVSADLVADLKEKLRGDQKLGGEAIDVTAGSPGAQIGVDYERYLPRWVVAELDITVRYYYDKASR